MAVHRTRNLWSIGSAALLCSTAGAQWQAAPEVIAGAGARSFAGAIASGSTIYSIGGRPFVGIEDNTVAFSHVEGGAAWTQLAGMEGQVIGQGSGIDALGNIIVFAGKDFDNGDTGNNRMYDPVEGFTGGDVPDRPGNPPPIGFSFCTDSLGRIYSIGGGDSEDFGPVGSASALVSRYDGNTNAWTALAPLPAPVSWSCAVEDDAGRILVIGGVNADGSARTTEVQSFDPFTGSWSTTAIPDLPVALSDAAAARGADGWVYVVGGRTGPIGAGTTISTTYLLNPNTNAWTLGPDLATPRRNLAAAVLPVTDGGYLYAIGGENDAGGTATVERLYTPGCPVVVSSFDGFVGWAGAPASLAVQAAGGGTLSYQWYHEGSPINDGPKNVGSYAGTDTPELLISPVTLEDAGEYTCIITNACGQTVESGEFFVRTPASVPQDPNQWSVAFVHPAGAVSSRINAIEGDRAVGSAVYLQTWNGSPYPIARPLVWTAPAWSLTDLTPGGSVGGNILAISGDLAVGWFWHVYNCFPGQCGWQSAGYWNLNTGVFTERHASGAEFSSIEDISGEVMVGYATFDLPNGLHRTNATIHRAPSYWPSQYSDRTFSAIDADHIFGSIYASGAHARRWDADTLAELDMEPVGATASTLSGAGDRQAVGSSTTAGASHATLWAGGAASASVLAPAGAASSSASDCADGLQVGTVIMPGESTHAAIWSGSPGSWFDLHDALPPHFTSSLALGVETRTDGTVVVVGTAYNSTLSNYHAVIWTSSTTASCPADLTGSSDPNDPSFGVPDGDADGDDFFFYLDAFAASNLGVCDLTGSSDPNAGSYGNPDGDCDGDDFFFYLDLFVGGCP